jgi:hypothetical protein
VTGGKLQPPGVIIVRVHVTGRGLEGGGEGRGDQAKQGEEEVLPPGHFGRVSTQVRGGWTAHQRIQ